MTDLRLYRLQGLTPVLETDPVAWSRWMASAGARARIKVAVTPVEGMVVATMFTGVDVRPGSAVAARPKPRVWTTSVTARSDARLTGYDGFATTYETRAAAAKGHVEMVRLLRQMMRRMRSNGDGPAAAH